MNKEFPVIFKKIFLPVLFILIFSPLSVFAKDGNVKILSPENGAVVNGEEVTISLHLPSDGGHLHVYLDDEMKLMADSKNLVEGKVQLSKVPKGEHTLKIVLSGHNHMEMKEAEYTDEITFKVE